MFHALSYYAFQLNTLKEGKIRYFLKGLNLGIQIVTLLVAALRNSFKDVDEFAKKAEAIEKQRKVKTKEKKARICII